MAEEKIYAAGTPMKEISSGMGKLNWRDAGKGAIVAFLTALIAGVYQVLNTSPMVLDMSTVKPVLVTAVTAFLAYLLKNLFTDAKVVVPKN